MLKFKNPIESEEIIYNKIKRNGGKYVQQHSQNAKYKKLNNIKQEKISMAA